MQKDSRVYGSWNESLYTDIEHDGEPSYLMWYVSRPEWKTIGKSFPRLLWIHPLQRAAKKTWFVSLHICVLFSYEDIFLWVMIFVVFGWHLSKLWFYLWCTICKTVVFFVFVFFFLHLIFVANLQGIDVFCLGKFYLVDSIVFSLNIKETYA